MSEEKPIEAIESELAARLGTPLEQLRAQRAHCPPLASVRALASGTMPEEMQTALQQHVSSCDSCGALAADLLDDELTAPSENEGQRIAARIAAGKDKGASAASASQTSRRGAASPRFTFLRPALAGVALLALFVVISRVGNQPPTPPIATQGVPPAPVIPAVLRLEMPEVHLRAAIVLQPRGEKAASSMVQDMAPALDAYRAQNYAAAARRFAELEKKYPGTVELLFYHGISQLALGQNDDALRLLEHAALLEEEEFAIEIEWYRGLTEYRAGRVAASRARLGNLCKGKSEFTARACEAVKVLDAQ